jgi:hypothetical protein
MELYLRWLAKHETEDDEQPPIGIVLCAGKKQEQIELLELDSSGIHVAEYLTVLPEKHLLEQKLKQAIDHARHFCRIPSTHWFESICRYNFYRQWIFSSFGFPGSSV